MAVLILLVIKLFFLSEMCVEIAHHSSTIIGRACAPYDFFMLAVMSLEKQRFLYDTKVIVVTLSVKIARL
ncbi:hypothetical protein HY496_00920 [Candidatus Woesearchaeota archaeon]|nr:hypothetical protein [Candidatus Woesearchaeota archaeon]